MKLASLKDGSRDGVLIVVSRDLQNAVRVPNIARTFQDAIDNWETTSPTLKEVYKSLNEGRYNDSFRLDTIMLASPLPRTYQWLDGSAYLNHVALVRKARGVEMPPSFWTDPLMYQGGSDSFIGPNDPILVENDDWGIDFEAEVAVITDDVPMGINATNAGQHIKLLMLVNDVSLRKLIPAELAKGFGFMHGKPATSFSPVAITPDELGAAWDGKKVNLPIVSHLNGKLFGKPNAGIDMTFSFPQLIAHAARTRFLGTGTIIGSGTVSNIDNSNGFSCLMEKRMLEIIDSGKATTPFMRFGDKIRIEMLDKNGDSIFGTIEQEVVKYETI